METKGKIILYHGSDHIVEKPEYGKGKVHNDYGLGFYMTEDMELAKEWSAGQKLLVSYVNEYLLDIDELNTLNFEENGCGVLNWIATLVANRVFVLKKNVERNGRKFLIQNYSVDVNKYDIITGWRADDAYFQYAQDFLINALTVSELDRAMHLGNLGKQIVLKSRKAFSRIKFIEATKVDSQVYYIKKTEREKKAKEAYYSFEKNNATDIGYLSNIMAKIYDIPDMVRHSKGDGYEKI